MFTTSRDFLQYEIRGTDYHVGQVRDLLFEDLDWRIRYFVVEIANPIFDRKVLVSPVAVAQIDHSRRWIKLDLTKEKIENSPVYDSDMPVSRQYETALRRYYEWPEYWGQNAFLDNDRERQMPLIPDEDDIQPDSGIPVPGVEDEGRSQQWPVDLETSVSAEVTQTMPSEPDDEDTAEKEFIADEDEFTSDADLRSANEMTRYYVHLLDGRGGFVTELFVDPEDWGVKYLVMRTEKVPDGRQVLLAFQWIMRITWRTSTIYVHLTQENVKEFPEYIQGRPVTPEFEKQVYRVYDRIMYP